MEPKKRWRLLQQLDAETLQGFMRFVSSPYYNSGKAVIALLKEVVALISKEKELEDRKIWAKIYPSEAYNDVRFRKIVSELGKLLRKYLATQQLQQDPVSEPLFTLRHLLDKGLTADTESILALTNERIENQPFRNHDFQYQKYQIEKAAYEVHELENYHMERSNIEAIIGHLDTFYLSEKLRLYCSMLSRTNIVKHDYQLLFIDEIIEHVDREGYFDCVSVRLYYLMLQTFRHQEDETFFRNLVTFAGQHYLQFPKMEMYNVYGQALNCCIIFINKGRLDFLEEYRNLFFSLLEKGLAYSPSTGELSPWRFANTVSVLNRLGLFQISETFIAEQQAFLPAQWASNAVSYNLAQVYFYQKKYDAVLLQLREVEYEDVSYNLGAKAIMLATYFETSEWVALDHLIDSFSTFLKRNQKLTPDRKKNYQNLVKFLKKLLELRFSDRKALQQLIVQVQESPVASKKWLLEKIQESV
jgi:hypothetical protein